MTTWLKTKNNACSTLNAAITAGATTFVLKTGEGARFPTTFPFHVSIENEVIEVTSGVYDTFTGTRAAESTIATSHPSNAAVRLNITSGILEQLQAEIDLKVTIGTNKLIFVSRDMQAPSGDVVYTSVGFQPSSIIAIASVWNTSYSSWGFSDSSAQEGCLCEYNHGSRTYQNVLIFLSYASDASAIQSAAIKSYDADGFTLTWTKAGAPAAGNGQLIFLCLK